MPSLDSTRRNLARKTRLRMPVGRLSNIPPSRTGPRKGIQAYRGLRRVNVAAHWLSGGKVRSARAAGLGWRLAARSGGRQGRAVQFPLSRQHRTHPFRTSTGQRLWRPRRTAPFRPVSRLLAKEFPFELATSQTAAQERALRSGTERFLTFLFRRSGANPFKFAAATVCSMMNLSKFRSSFSAVHLLDRYSSAMERKPRTRYRMTRLSGCGVPSSSEDCCREDAMNWSNAHRARSHDSCPAEAQPGNRERVVDRVWQRTSCSVNSGLQGEATEPCTGKRGSGGFGLGRLAIPEVG